MNYLVLETEKLFNKITIYSKQYVITKSNLKYEGDHRIHIFLSLEKITQYILPCDKKLNFEKIKYSEEWCCESTYMNKILPIYIYRARTNDWSRGEIKYTSLKSELKYYIKSTYKNYNQLEEGTYMRKDFSLQSIIRKILQFGFEESLTELLWIIKFTPSGIIFVCEPNLGQDEPPF
ncbi:hypothetical protein [Flavobacterium ovatum]|jgi:hypothetical protein|uniref:hypothetical protein n=1 Tax=Flavobacterium ovatum TaxID=1928857 RepID=UPI00344ED6E3